MDKKYNWSKWLLAFIFAVAVITVYKTFDNLANVFGAIGSFINLLMPFIIGAILAFFLYPACKKVEEFFSRSKRKKISESKKGLSVLVVYAAFILIIVLAISLLMPRLSASVAEFVKRLPEYMDEINAFIITQAEKGGIFDFLDTNQIAQFLSFENLYNIFFRGNWNVYMEGVKGVTSTVASWFMGIIICAYILNERDSLFYMGRKLSGAVIKKDTMNKISHYVSEISSIFYKFFFGKAIDSIIIGIIALIGFIIIDVPYALLMAVITLLFNMIPYFGPIIGAIPVVVVTLLVNDIYSAIWTLLFIIVLQQVDSNIIGPKILGDSVGVSPFWVIFAILVFGGLFGVTGMIIGVPAIAAIRMLLLDYLDDKELQPKSVATKDETK
ncbi:MAG: AI-2E family transporter [Clostridia bacterium]|nr:AI-2E family transporter [Clostridia bacterium]